MMEISNSKNKESSGSPIRRIWLVRHGTTLWNSEQCFCGHSDIPLSPLGIDQAHWLADYLHLAPIGVIYTSDLLRARQTAEIIARSHSQPVQIQPSTAWRELDFGAWEGLPYAQIAERFPQQLAFFTDPLHTSPPDGENFTILVQRVWNAFLAMICERDSANQPSQHSDIVLVSHGGPLRALLCCILKMPLERQWQLRLNPGSLSALEFLPTTDEMIPDVTLTLLNVQRPDCPDYHTA
jgi:broad specificity phosphatase PhoE